MYTNEDKKTCCFYVNEIHLEIMILPYIDKKIEHQFDAKLETKKAILEKKIYVSQHKFDKEYMIIQELTEESYDFTYLRWDAYYTVGKSDTDDSYIKKYNKACDDFTLFYMKNCAFIPEELAKTFDLFVKKINEFRLAVNNYNELLIKVMKRDTTLDKEDKLFESYIDTMRTIHDDVNKKSDYSHGKLVEITRKYYERLEVK